MEEYSDGTIKSMIIDFDIQHFASQDFDIQDFGTRDFEPPGF